MIFARKNARLHIKTRLRPGRGQMFEAETEARILASKPLWPRGLNITADQARVYPLIRIALQLRWRRYPTN